MAAPNVYIVIGGSAIARDEKGEILETVDKTADGEWDWAGGGICDARGGGGAAGFALLDIALDAAEANARELGFELTRVPA
jgi:hypothetical protein